LVVKVPGGSDARLNQRWRVKPRLSVFVALELIKSRTAARNWTWRCSHHQTLALRALCSAADCGYTNFLSSLPSSTEGILVRQHFRAIARPGDFECKLNCTCRTPQSPDLPRPSRPSSTCRRERSLREKPTLPRGSMTAHATNDT
jgi:hypothetical protein